MLPLLASLASTLIGSIGLDEHESLDVRVGKTIIYIIEACFGHLRSRRRGHGQHVKYLLAVAAMLASHISSIARIEGGRGWLLALLAVRVGLASGGHGGSETPKAGYDAASERRLYEITKMLICDTAKLGGRSRQARRWTSS